MTNLHVWQIGPGIFSVIMVIRTAEMYSVDFYKAEPDKETFSHLTLELDMVDET
ncbi:MAG: hypothetical protein AAF065_07910 [Verrucomicrobiota bacterium]